MADRVVMQKEKETWQVFCIYLQANELRGLKETGAKNRVL